MAVESGVTLGGIKKEQEKPSAKHTADLWSGATRAPSQDIFPWSSEQHICI